MADSKKPSDGEDVLLTGETQDNGMTPYLRHRPDHTLEAGMMASAKAANRPANMKLKYREDGVYDVVSDTRDASGPAKVTNDKYRNGWDSVFGGRQPIGQA